MDLSTQAGGKNLLAIMEDGRPLRHHYVTRLFEKLRVKACLPKITLNGTRREHASLQLAAGTLTEVVSKRLTPKSTATTANLHSHSRRSNDHVAANAAALSREPRTCRPRAARYKKRRRTQALQSQTRWSVERCCRMPAAVAARAMHFRACFI